MLLLGIGIFLAIFAQTYSAIDENGPRREILEKALDGVRSISNEITDSIDSFHFYKYDGHPYDVHNGGYDMFDGMGNKVYHTNEDITDVLYDYNLAYGNYVYGVRSNQPLFGLVWIRNVRKEFHTYRIQIDGYPGFGASRTIETSENELVLDGAKIQYKVFQVHGHNVPTICEVYFVLENEKWNSDPADNLTVMTFSKTANFLQNSVYISGKPSNVLMGYMLLSNNDGTVIPTEEYENVLNITANAVIEIDPNLRNFTESALQAVEAQLQSIRNAVKNWYNYTYSMQEILNGGEDMYGRRGNRIHFKEDNDNPTKLYYGLSYSGNTYKVTSRSTHPFFGLMWIENSFQKKHTYFWQVTGFAGKNIDGLITSFEGRLTVESTNIQYKVFSLNNIRSHPSICEVYFTVDSRNWNSSLDFDFDTKFGNDSENLDNTATVEGQVNNVLLGYLLLSKKYGSRVSAVEVKDIMTLIAEKLDKIDKVTSDQLESIADSIENASKEISSIVSDWHQYSYDEQFYKLSYEPREMYNPWGNMMVLEEDLDHATYNRTNYDLYYSYKKSAILCNSGYPFVALTMLDDEKFNSYSLKIHSHVELPGNEEFAEYRGTFSVMHTRVDYTAFHIFGRKQPNICEVFFVLSNPTNWSSVMIDFYIGDHFERTKIRDNYIYLLGYIKNVFMGYTLLSKYPGYNAVTEDEVQSTVSLIAKSVTESIPSIKDILYCKKEDVVYPNDNNPIVTFPETAIGCSTSSITTCGLDSPNEGIPYGNRKCSNEGKWHNPTWISSCFQEQPTQAPIEETTSGNAKAAFQVVFINTMLLQLIVFLII